MPQNVVRMPTYNAHELELRRLFLRAILWGLGLGILAYALLAAAGSIFPLFFPWDALIAVIWIAITIWLYRRGTSRSLALSASWVVAGVTIVAVIYSQQFGIRHPISALFIICIILAGMLIGGSFLRVWTVLVALFILLWSYLEWMGLHENVSDPIGSVTELWQTALLWATLIAISGGLMGLFAGALERRMRVSTGQTAALTRTLNALSTDPELDTFLRQILTTAVDLFEARFASIYLLDPQQEKLFLRMTCEQTAGSKKETRNTSLAMPALETSGPIWQELAEFQAPLPLNDLAQDNRLAAKSSFTAAGIASILFVPLLQEQTPSGYLSIGRSKKRRFRREQRELAQALAQQAILEMRLSQVAEQEQENAILEERNRIAREIHDTLAQGFTGIILQLDMAKYSLPHDPDAVVDAINRAVVMAKESLEEARRSVWSLHPQALENEDLASVLEKSAEQLTAETGIGAEVEVIGEPYRLSQATEGELLRIGQQGVTNALRHGGATLISVHLIYHPEKLTMVVRDDGRGFDPNGQGSGFGMKSMTERAERIQAELKIFSSPEQGTDIICTVLRDPAAR